MQSAGGEEAQRIARLLEIRGCTAEFTMNGVQDVEDFPENAARWTGEKVQEVEDIPQDMENKWDNMVGGVERFGDNMENAYDEGRDEQRYEDDDY